MFLLEWNSERIITISSSRLAKDWLKQCMLYNYSLCSTDLRRIVVILPKFGHKTIDFMQMRKSIFKRTIPFSSCSPNWHMYKQSEQNSVCELEVIIIRRRIRRRKILSHGKNNSLPRRHSWAGKPNQRTYTCREIMDMKYYWNYCIIGHWLNHVITSVSVLLFSVLGPPIRYHPPCFYPGCDSGMESGFGV
jgi:hypothetical protein